MSKKKDKKQDTEEQKKTESNQVELSANDMAEIQPSSEIESSSDNSTQTVTQKDENEIDDIHEVTEEIIQQVTTVTNSQEENVPDELFGETSELVSVIIPPELKEELPETSEYKEEEFDEKTSNILRERAKELSREQAEDTRVKTFIELVMFSLGEELYAIPTKNVREVRTFDELTPVPCTPDFIFGVLNVRGNIYSVVDLRLFLGIDKSQVTSTSQVILVHSSDLELGFIVDSVMDKVNIPESEVKVISSAMRGIREEYLDGVFYFENKMVVILNFDMILKDDRIVISEQVV
jgi:purine-binding chemotaxis protein CheW